MSSRIALRGWGIAALMVSIAAPALADETGSNPSPTAGRENKVEQPKPKPAPYSLPWQLRPVTVGNFVRWDNTLARYEGADSRLGFTYVSILNGAVKIPGTGKQPGTGLGVLLRLPFVYDTAPGGPRGAAIGNPLLGAVYSPKLPGPFKLNFCLGFTLPVGMGGGDKTPGPPATPAIGEKDARVKAIPARAGMDNALFAVNDVAITPGVSFAYVAHRLTVQVDAGIFGLVRVRGCSTAALCDQPEEAKTNFTTGMHLGYFILTEKVLQISLGLDMRYQRWLNAPLSVENTKPTVANGYTSQSAAYDNLTFAIGPRFHIPIGKMWLRPGIAYSRALDKPMSASTPNYHLFQIDVPLQF
jgi:hypothetical protein